MAGRWREGDWGAESRPRGQIWRTLGLAGRHHRLQQRLTLFPHLRVTPSKISPIAHLLGFKTFEYVGIDPSPGGHLLKLSKWAVSGETQVFKPLVS